VLRVCADPNNLPFSNAAGEGLENAMARLVAHAMNATLAYTWWPQRRGFLRATLGARRCDVMMEVPAGDGRVATTRPYYLSSYVFVWRRDRRLALRTLDDPALRGLRIGVQTIGDDCANSPPAAGLGRRGLARQLVGFPVYGDYSQPMPLAPIMRAVAAGQVDVAIVWGPLAAWWAAREPVPLELAPVPPEADPGLPFSFAIAMGVRRDDEALRRRLDGIIEAHRVEIARLLRPYLTLRQNAANPANARHLSDRPASLRQTSCPMPCNPSFEQARLP